MVKITATNHDLSDPTVVIVIVRPQERAARAIELLRECGYRTITVEAIEE